MITCAIDSGYQISPLKIISVCIAIVVAYIARSQYKVNKNKLRLDLYNRRFSVYERALDYFQDYYFGEDKTKLEKKDIVFNEFIKSFRESSFLFGSNSDVYKYMEELKDTIAFMYAEKATHHVDARMFDWMEMAEKFRDPSAIMEDLENSLRPWIDSSKIERPGLIGRRRATQGKNQKK